MLYLKRLFMVLAASLLITSCSSSSGPGTATITAENSKDLAVAATEAAKSTSATDDVSFGFKTGGTVSGFSIDAFSKQVGQMFYATLDLSAEFCDNSTEGGIFIIEEDSPGSNSGSVTISDCLVGEATINGTMTVTTTSSSFTMSATLTITQGTETETISVSSSCVVTNDQVGQCSYSSTFSGIDGRTYTAANMSVSGNPFDGYTVSGSVTDPAHGVITITTTNPIRYSACTRGNPSAGEIVITGDTSATVTYNDCESFTINFNGSSTTYNWADI